MNFKPNLLISFLVLLGWAVTANAQNDAIPDSAYFPPQGEHKNVAILFLGGSEGGLPTYYDTEYFTSQGYPCFLLGYFETRNTPEKLELIPLEYIENALKTFMSKPEVQNKKIVVWGASKGGELALLLASRYKEIQGVIAKVPSSVVFQGTGPNSVSSWSDNGQALPFVPYVDYDWSTVKNSEYVDMFRQSLQQTEFVENAIIPVEKINGPILILSGQSDRMWPSSQMGENIIERLNQSEFPFWHKHYAYEDAGHTFSENYPLGGTEAGNESARIDSDKRIKDFLLMLSRQ